MFGNNEPHDNKFSFLKGGGETGELIRKYDWSANVLGSPENWPQSLKTTISIILNSKFPMFLFWGPELICFYNDAYRPSLGINGKHPSMLGSRGKDSWQEIWADIKPLIDQVLAGGEATWSEDQLLPIYRNGTLEDVYWTFSYSPVIDESSKPAGVFVTCSETTGKVLAHRELEDKNRQLQEAIEAETISQKQIRESERNLRLIISQAPVSIAIFRGKNYVVEIVNSRALELWGKTQEEVQSKPILDMMPELKSQGIQQLLNHVYETGEPFSAKELPVQLFRNQQMETAYIDFVYEPLYDWDSHINGIITIGIEVTTQVLARRKIEESEKRFRAMAESSDILIAVGDETGKATYFNKAWENITGKSVEELLEFGWSEFIHPDDKDHFMNLYSAAFEKRDRFKGELRAKSKEGDYRWLICQGSPRFHPDGSFAGYISSSIDITERKQYQRDLQASEQRLEAILRQLPLPVLVLKGNSQVIETANEALLSFWKKKQANVIGKPMLEVFPELEKQVFPTLWKYVMDTGKAISNTEKEVVYNQPDGSKRKYYVDYFYQPLFDKDNKIDSVLATIIDVTDKVQSRKLLEDSQAELQAINEELAVTNEELSSTNEELIDSQVSLQLMNSNLYESQSLLEFTLEAAELATWDMNPVTKHFTGNDRFKSWFRLSADELTMANAINSIDEKDLERVLQAFNKAMDGKSDGKYEVEYSIKDPDSETNRFVKAKGKFLFDEQHQPIRFIGTLQDITKEHKANMQLEETNQRLKMALDAGKLGSFDLDLITGNMNCTSQCKANFGWEEEDDFSLKDLLAAALPDHQHSIEQQIQAAIENEGVFEAEYQTQWPDKSVHWISISGKPVYNKDGKAIRMAGVTLEITERKLDDLRKNDFIGMVSHELKTPLTSLSAFLQILQSKIKDSNDSFTGGLLDKASLQIKKMSTLINGFLNVSRFESGKINIVKRAFNLDDLLREIIKETELTTSSHTIYFEPCAPVTVYADQDKIGSVVSNLLSNAVKYSMQGKSITVTCKIVGKTAQVSVADEGIGIKPVDQEKLFDRYYRVESNNTQHISGFGIGLYLSAEIVQRHNGNIWVESESGKGSTFYFTLPLSASPE